MNGYELVRLQPNQVKKTGDTMTGNLTMNGNAKFVGNLQGNATTATTLQNSRTINGTAFNGSQNITTTKWGTVRDITIGNTTKQVDGSGNVTWTLQEIGASANAIYKTNVSANQWQANGTNYKFLITHNLNSNIIHVGGVDATTNESVFVPFKIINNNSLEIYTVDNTLSMRITVISETLSAGGGGVVGGATSVTTGGQIYNEINGNITIPDHLPLTGGTLTNAKPTNKIDIKPDNVEIAVSTILERNSIGLGYNAGDDISLRIVNSPFEGASIGAKDNIWNELNSTIYLGRGITTITPHHASNSVTFRTKDNFGNVVDSAFEPNGNWELGTNVRHWNNVWFNGLRSGNAGFLISANDNGTDLVGRGGIWINANGLRPLNGDNAETCGQNGFRWSAVWCVNANNTTSDITLKKNIERIDISTTKNKDVDDKKFYNFVKDDLSFYSWDWKDEKLNEDVPTNIGVMAQELEQSEVGKMIVIPPKQEEVEKEVFDEDGNRTIEKETITTNYAINDRNMYMSLGIALKQAINEIENLKKEIEILKSK